MKAAYAVIAALVWGTLPHAQTQLEAENTSGLRMLVANKDNPTLAIILPNHPESDRSINILFPEHVTAKRKGSDEANHLYLFSGRYQTGKPLWRKNGNSLEYERDLDGGVRLLARATLEDDGVLFHYEFVKPL